MKVKVKVGGNSRQFAGGQVSNESVESVIARNKRDAQKSMFPKRNQSVQKAGQSIFGRMVNIVVEDVKTVFHIDTKRREREMAYKEFMERFFK
jgi:hypothetical protein